MQDLKLIKIQLRHLRTEIRNVHEELNTKASAVSNENYYTKAEIDLYLNSVRDQILTLQTSITSLAGSLISLQKV